ncbi:MAG: hypothetical protein ACD_79C01535G0005 [uncultured bacterium]|nr:MAG: hypothetical protein ACD_79C01535G0005 [uncultured bacterium]
MDLFNFLKRSKWIYIVVLLISAIFWAYFAIKYFPIIREGAENVFLMNQIIEESENGYKIFYPFAVILILISFCIIIISFISNSTINQKIKLFNFVLLLNILSNYFFTPDLLHKIVFIFLLFFIILYLFDLDFRFKINNKWINLLFENRIFIVILILVNTSLFLCKFIPSDFTAIIYADDYPKYFTLSKNQSQNLFSGMINGWNRYFSGGYPYVLDLRFMGWLYYPFSFFNDWMGFHLMLLASYISIPVLIFLLSSFLKLDKLQRIASSLIATLFMLSYFKKMLAWGLVPNFLALPFVILSILFLEKYLENKGINFLFLILSLSAIFYLHLTTLFFILTIIFIRVLYCKKEKLFFKLIIKIMFFLIGINFSYVTKILHDLELIVPTFSFDSSGFETFTLDFYLSKIKFIPALSIWIFNNDLIRLLFILLPIVIGLRKNHSTSDLIAFYYYGLFISILIFSFIFPICAIDGKYTIPLIVSIILGKWIVNVTEESFYIIRIFILIFLSFFIIDYGGLINPINHINTLPENLVNEINTSSRGRVLFETVSNFSPFADHSEKYQRVNDPHFDGILQLLTDKKFLNNYGEDPYPYHKFREGLIVNGAWEGKDISCINITHLMNILEKWDVKKVIVWSESSKKYFLKNSNLFKNIKKFDKYISLDTNFENTPHQILINEGTFDKRILVMNAKKGDQIIIKENFYNDWKIYFNEKQIKYFNKDGQFCFIAPIDNNFQINMVLPKRNIFNIISILFLLILCVLAFNKKDSYC